MIKEGCSRIQPPLGQRTARLAKWGLEPFWLPQKKPGGPHINARAETLSSSPMFRGPLSNGRCLIPATGFFEWQKRGGKKEPPAANVVPVLFV